MTLEEELDNVAAELAAALTEQARLNARIAGLQAQRDALRQALGPLVASEPDAADIATMTKSDAIVAVLRAAGRPLAIGEIVKALQDAGRPDENYNGISVYLQDLLSRSRVQRPMRGQYVAA